MWNIGKVNSETAEGAAYNEIVDNIFAGCDEPSGLIGVGFSWLTRIVGNTFSGTLTSTTVRIVGANGVDLSGNTFRGVARKAIWVGDSGVPTSNIRISGNDVEQRASYSLDHPAIYVYASPYVRELSITGNRVSHPISYYGTGQVSHRVYGNVGPGVDGSVPEPTKFSR